MATKSDPQTFVNTGADPALQALYPTTTQSIPASASTANVYITQTSQVNYTTVKTTNVVNQAGGNANTVQFKTASGTFAGDDGFVYNPDTDTITTGKLVVTSNATSNSILTGSAVFSGGIGIDGNVVANRTLYVGFAANAAILQNPTIIAKSTGTTYVQGALINVNENGSADWVAYADNSDDTKGWADMGMTGSDFNDPAYTITGINDGYVFVQGTELEGAGGNLVLATGNLGEVKDIVFATGGFDAENEFARIDHANNRLHLTRSGSGIKFADGSVQTTASTGGGGNTGNITFDDVVVQGAGAQLFLSPDPTFTANLAYVQIRAGDVASHIHVDTGNNEAYDLIIGNDQKFVQVGSTGNIIMSSYDNATTPYRMTLDYNGQLTVPGDIQSITTGFSFTSNISNVDTTVANTVIVTVSDTQFPAPVTGQVTITDVVGTTEANGTWYFEAVEADQFQLYYDAELNYPVNGTGWPAYVSGGLAVALGYNDLGITGGNVSITNNTGHDWIFAKGGGTIYPTLTVTRGDRTGTLTGQTLLFGDSTQEAIVSTPNGTNDINASQRFVINPGAGAAGTTGEGGDIYLYAGRGGDAGGSGGDIKIRGGLAPADGTGGYLDIQGGDTQGNGTGGYIDIRGGESGSAAGGAVNLYGGYGPTVGGNVTITGGVSGNGLSNYGNVSISSGALTWTFDNTGTLTVPGNLVAISASPAPVISGFSSVSALQFTNGTGNVTVNANSNLWNFDDTGNLTIPGSSGGFIKTVANASIGIAAVDNGTNNPAQLLSMTNAGAATSIVSAYATNALIQTNATGTMHTWSFDNAGNLTLPGNTFSVNYANGIQVSLGGVNSIIANGNSNVTIATSAGNVVTNVNGAAVLTTYTGGIKVGGSGILQSPGGASAITLNNNGANIPTANITTALNVTGNANITGNISATGTLTATGKIGYASGSSVTQSTSRGTAVTLNALSGEITLFTTTMAANQVDFFTMTNDKVNAGDMIVCTTYGGSAGSYLPMAYVSSDTQVIFTFRYLETYTSGSEAPKIKFIVIKAPTA